MKKISLIAMLAFVSGSMFSQNVGIGTTLPAAKLDVKSTSSYVGQFNGAAPMYMGIFENDVYRGYWGSYSGNAEDVDFGTGSGTTGKLHLTIQAVPKLTIDNTGNVGIGTTAPTHRLHVATGDVFIQTSAGHLKMGYEGSNQWGFPTTGGGADLMMTSSPDGGTTTNYRHYFAQNGDVGIGVAPASPVARLDVKSNSTLSTTAAFMVRNSNNDTLLKIQNNGYVGIGYNQPGYGRPLNIEGGGANFYYNRSTFGGAVFPDANNNIVIWSNNSGPGQNVVLQPSWGQVCIGTYTPATGYLLNIDGKAICNELKVQLTASWPDYVFSGDYKLPSLEDLEHSINLNKHLPNIPSSADITADKGFEVGDMNRRLLEKVEELTLYIIEINKQNKQLQKTNKTLEQRLDAVEKIQAQKN
jgi:hypothetical protein